MNAMLDKAEQEPDRPLAIAIVDADAKLLSYARMDNCRALPQRMAMSKAYTSAMSGSDSNAYAERLKNEGRNIADFGDPQLVAVQGSRGGPRSRNRPGPGRHRRQRPVGPGGRGPGPPRRAGAGAVSAFHLSIAHPGGRAMTSIDLAVGAADETARPPDAGNMLIRRLKISGMLSFGPQGIGPAHGTAERAHRTERVGQVQLH